MSDDRQEPWTGKTPEGRPGGVAPSGGRPPDGRPDTPAGPPREPTRVRPATTAWSGRAEVPPPRSAHDAEAAPAEWYVEDQGDRRWWMPIVVASVALAAFAVLGLGLWLVARTGPEATPRSPLPSPSAEPPTSAPPTSPSTRAPTTQARVPMPNLVGLPRSAAEAALDRLGLGYRSELRRSDRPAGTVLGTEPKAGERVPVGTDVTLVVSEGSQPTSPSGASPAPTPPPTTGRTPTAAASR
ncbi:PASTA domain-containing protein [Micromonospora pallida]|uniref:PASTA domain-containing protein n=1 Tax=Micromonospora pallida TaxID=145854 RepID=A0A1C6TAK2_9ACTN|nr:Stk1 family PASTA domain-containing Ser/Thr kinase [Micromonospora pallida]SCL38592.1 PASTA domain-containing protein [Micromonospora pallida]